MSEILPFERIVWRNKGNGQKLVTIPKYTDIHPGDKVKIEKVQESESSKQ
jgi:hypothetical protein